MKNNRKDIVGLTHNKSSKYSYRVRCEVCRSNIRQQDVNKVIRYILSQKYYFYCMAVEYGRGVEFCRTYNGDLPWPVKKK